jgi:hypothetical protein
MVQYIETINATYREQGNILSQIHPVEDDRHWCDLVFFYSAETIFNAVQDGQRMKEFSFADQYFYFDCEGRYIKSFNTIQNLKNHFDPKNN